MTESRESRPSGRDETLEDRFKRQGSERPREESPIESEMQTNTGDAQGGGHSSVDQLDSSNMLVPSAMEPGAVNRYVVSKQIRQMQEPRYLTPDDLAERRIIYPDSPDRKLVNRFRNLRTKLLEMSGHRNFALVVTGATEGAGASYIAMNLAAAFAFDESKTALLIDCNLREPSLHTALDMAPEAGLTDFLEEPEYDIARIIYPTGIPRLRLIPAGSRRESPGEFFTSFRMRQFMQAVRRRYPDRFIILDTASVGESPDARILAELCDYSLLVVPHGRVTPSVVEQAAGAFQREKFAGAIING
ncbi:P-loop NTPase family protein [Tamilnaduibacter salinus]|uniref:polysaccharide biosynthesis protein n=1 Tax=Tamilnaduibacter salinus TaxID=1484056 RepID=UPI001D175755|nr:polysaccharide biosynthesis protein [Tamilnaduibacter salinus]